MNGRKQDRFRVAGSGSHLFVVAASSLVAGMVLSIFANRLAGRSDGATVSEGAAAWVFWVLIGVLLFLVALSFSREQRARSLAAAMAEERRKSEELSGESEQRFRLLIESVTDYGIFMLGPKGQIASWNPGAERIKGYSSEEIIGRHFSRFYSQEDKNAHKPDRELEIAAAVGRFAEEGWRVRKDGSRFWASVVITAVRDERRVLVGFAKVTRDLSERRQADQRLALAYDLQQAIIASVPYAIIATEPDGIIRSVNPAAERMLWYKGDELVGKANPCLIHDPREIAARAVSLGEELGTTLEPGLEVFVHKSRFGIVEEREWQYLRKDGSRLPVHLAVSALRDADDAISGFLFIAYDITLRKRREDYSYHVAHHDFLTGLPNRMLLRDRLEMAVQLARRSKQKVAVLMLDLDHFKNVNDSLGHHVGDELLKCLAERIGSCVRAVDTVARIGGDEFVIVLGQIKEGSDAERIAANIVQCVGKPAPIGGHELTVTSSIGISYFPDDGDTAELLLKNADSAMYRAKASGRHGYRAFNNQTSPSVKRWLEIENALQQALAHEEFTLHYQPQVCLHTGDVIGMEALLRWDGPILGQMSPDQFIPVAEESGLIVPLGEWVLRTACIEAREIQLRTNRPLRLAVNLSARQFRQDNLVAVIREALEQSGLAAGFLELEITESVLMIDTDETIERLREIRSLGVTIAIDDFGVGYSSLSYITRFPIDTLKIDRSFVGKLPSSTKDAAVAHAIIALGESLSLTIIAEGIETTEQLEFMRGSHCSAAQGFLLGQPLPSGAFDVQGCRLGAAVTA